jgi:3-deoxy-7-phosphoheptulonate synthase
MGRAGLKLLARAREETGLLIVTEAMDAEEMDFVAEVADIIQLGARNMQNYSLLKRAGRSGKPILLKRGLSATIQELLLSAEYILAEGNPHVILCERGVRGFDPATRNILDLSAIAVVHGLSHLPIIADPSHGTGHRDMVTPMARAAVAAGADGLLVEVHPNPDRALSDGAQSLYPSQFDLMMKETRLIAEAIGRRVAGLMVSIAAPLSAQNPGEIIGRAARVYRSLASLQADFEQVIDNPMIDSAESKGTLVQSGDARLAMRFTDPPGEAIVIDGKHVWVYTPSTVPDQVIRMKVPSGGPAYGYNLLAWFLDRPSERYKPSFVRTERLNGRTTDVIKLVPAVPDLPFTQAVIWLDREDALPRRLEILEQSGATRTLQLSRLRVNAPIADNTFRFKVPAGARVVDQ